MSELNLQHLLDDISPESPCGENLEEDAGFFELENAAKFIEEKQMGDTIVPAEEPDWKEVRRLSQDLLARSHDIQVGIYLSLALLRTDGFDGFNQGLSLLSGWLETHWEEVYPIQDEEDDYPMQRINALSSLDDYALVRSALTRTALLKSDLGLLTWRNIEIAEGRAKAIEDEVTFELSVINAVFSDADNELLQTIADSVNQSLTWVQKILAVTSEKAGAANTPSLSALESLLQSIVKFLAQQFEGQASESENAEGDAIEAGGSAVSTGHTDVKKKGIHSRDDVDKALDEIGKYFEQYEPSSPIPFFLLRAKKQLRMNFIEILRDMTPDAVYQAETVLGAQNQEDN
ncbi:MAG: type VI secretion system protein TssA [Methyloprofundus sp.]|nr:type VI secretion system protein TssA [Methyloprofundus sp.]